ncbi:MAG: hypothetical protein U0X75_17680 [Acidobacteriota bacterium]
MLEAVFGKGVDCFVLETFHDLAEMQQAIRAVRRCAITSSSRK